MITNRKSYTEPSGSESRKEIFISIDSVSCSRAFNTTDMTESLNIV